ncbi:MAG: hypothetical protein A2261_02640 [Candidatus Magasanikbacteria bacterium RIFOXYA2_FULL_44_8]|uniref:Uncharacterized protein n=1 Tax=Candidatus Magasanikbacteria bacterium RIFOXYA2_FULL_44_8 TaxID=1798696 RepID=A0A1F6NK56_9BACT|nr:MAG: hypothetical protein A2261_02640 [Candidatus Magasanikbacteria bacterium RIFOXYA2_FULL_44_8]
MTNFHDLVGAYNTAPNGSQEQKAALAQAYEMADDSGEYLWVRERLTDTQEKESMLEKAINSANVYYDWWLVLGAIRRSHPRRTHVLRTCVALAADCHDLENLLDHTNTPPEERQPKSDAEQLTHWLTENARIRMGPPPPPTPEEVEKENLDAAVDDRANRAIITGKMLSLATKFTHCVRVYNLSAPGSDLQRAAYEKANYFAEEGLMDHTKSSELEWLEEHKPTPKT